MNNDVFYHELQKTYRYNFEHYTGSSLLSV